MTKKSVLPDSWDCPQVFRDRLGSEAGHQRIMVDEDHLLIILHAPPEVGQSTREGRFFWRKPSGEWESSIKGHKLALKFHLDEFQKIVLDLEDVESSATTSSDYFPVLEKLAPVLRTISHLHQVLQDARKAVVHDKDLINLRDEAYQLVRMAELCQASAKNGLEFSLAKKAEEQANAAHQMSVASHRLNLLAGFFFPIVTIASIFGMGLIEIPEENRAIVFIALMVIGFIGGVILTGFMAAKSKRGEPKKRK